MKSMWWLESSSFSKSRGVTFRPFRSATGGIAATTLSSSALSVVCECICIIIQTYIEHMESAS